MAVAAGGVGAASGSAGGLADGVEGGVEDCAASAGVSGAGWARAEAANAVNDPCGLNLIHSVLFGVDVGHLTRLHRRCQHGFLDESSAIVRPG